MELRIDNSKRGSFASCPQKYNLRYNHKLTSAYGSTALRFGSTWHGFQEGYYSSVLENGWGADNMTAAFNLGHQVWNKETAEKEYTDDYRSFENCVESFIHYLDEFKTDEGLKDIIAAERIFKIRMKLSDSEKKRFPSLASTDLYFTGKLDLEVSMSGQHWIEEFKTTGQSIKQQAQRLNRSAQLLGYTWAGKQLGHDIVGALVSIHQISSRKKQDGTYGKLTREFMRQPQIFSEADLASWRQSYLFTCDQIVQCSERNIWPCQYDSCYQFGRCSFVNICEQNRPIEEAILDGYVVEEWDVLKTGASREGADIQEKEED